MNPVRSQTAPELSDYAQGVRYFEQYLSDGGKDIPDARRQQVQGEIDKATQHVGKVRITTNVDDVPLGKTPLADTVMINAGQRRIAATKGAANALAK